MDPISWEELNALSCARQFAGPPEAAPEAALGADEVATTIARIGPIQSQTARSPFIGLAARLPGLTRETVATSYENGVMVRGSTLRGTVHTCTPGQHGVLDPTTRLGQRTLWQRLLKLQHSTLEELWAGVEEYAWARWRSPDELADHLRRWLEQHDEDTGVLDAQVGRYLAFGHGGLIRRPLKGGWEQQGAPGYRTAAAVVDRGPAPVDAPVAAARLHLRAHGPASRHDLAWWSGLGLRQVDAALTTLEEERPLWRRTGPDGREYVDLPGAPAPIEERGLRLLPEFDAILCGYDPKARHRFVDPEHHQRLWGRNNGLMLAPLLHDGRATGSWRLSGTGATRSLQVSWFAHRPRKSDLEAPIAGLAAALGLQIGSVTLERA